MIANSARLRRRVALRRIVVRGRRLDTLLDMLLWGLAALVAGGLVACDNGGATPDWSRMIIQPKLLPYGETDLFADKRAMRPLPAGTVSRESLGDPGRALTDATELTVPVTRELLERGRRRFAIACATCHGVAGDGDTRVAQNMQRRRPPSLHEPRLVALTPGALYRIIVDGYGLMPSYAKLIQPGDRWALVAYVRTLQLSWSTRLAALPPPIRGDVMRRLP